MILRSIKCRYSERDDTITHFQELYKLHRRQSKSPTLSAHIGSSLIYCIYSAISRAIFTQIKA